MRTSRVRIHTTSRSIRIISARSSGPLTVLQVGTINKPITARNGYAPIETVIYNIDKGLTALGHRSIVACSGDSKLTGEHFETVPRSLGNYCVDSSPEGDAQIDIHLARALERARRGDIDVIHMHQWFERVCNGSFDPPVPIVTTLHVPGHHSGMAAFRTLYPSAFAGSRSLLHPIAISDYQRRQYTSLAPAVATVPHGVDSSEYPWDPELRSDSYLLSIGRITSDKGQDTSIAVARRSGRMLILAGCVQNKKEDRDFFRQILPSIDLVADVSQEPVTAEYYERVMKPILASGKQVVYIGELSAEATKQWYGHAAATLFPIRWGEPFGMVLIESMACGTPVIAFREGSVPEIVRDGVTGFVVDSLDAMATSVSRLPEIDRGSVRQHVITHFSTNGMASAYARVYDQVLAAGTQPSAQLVGFRPEAVQKRSPFSALPA